MTTYLLGDSHLARVVRDLPRLGPGVTNLAVGGAVVDDVPAQLAAIDRASTATLVLSLGTNDADPTRGRPLHEFRQRLVELVDSRPRADWVYVASPGCTGDRISADWTADGIASYAAVAAEVVRNTGGDEVDTPRVLRPAGDAAFDPDGFHLSAIGYDLLLREIATVLVSRPGEAEGE